MSSFQGVTRDVGRENKPLVVKKDYWKSSFDQQILTKELYASQGSGLRR